MCGWGMGKTKNFDKNKPVFMNKENPIKESPSKKKKSWLNIACIIAPAFIAGFIAGSGLFYCTRKDPPKQEIVQADKESLETLIKSGDEDAVKKIKITGDDALIVFEGLLAKADREAKDMQQKRVIAGYYNVLGLEYLSRKRYENAEAAFARGLVLRPNYDILLNNLINTKFVLKKYEETISLIDRLRRVHEAGLQFDLSKIYVAYADELIKRGDYGLAEEKLKLLFEMEPIGNQFTDGAVLYLDIATYYYRQKNFQGCIRISQHLLKMAPYGQNVEKAKLHVNIALAYAGVAEQEQDPVYLDVINDHLSAAKKLAPNDSEIKSACEKYEDVLRKLQDPSKK